MSDDRAKALRELIDYRLPIESTLGKLSAFGWDAVEPPVTVTTRDVLQMLKRFLDGELSDEQLTDWADLLECRQDIDLPRHPINISQVIFRLANPNIKGPITHALVTKLQAQLTRDRR